MGLDNNQSTLVGSPILQAIPSPISIFPIVVISTSSISNSNKSIFCSILISFVLFGITGKPFCNPHLKNICASDIPCFFAIILNGESSRAPSAFISLVLALFRPSASLQFDSGRRLLYAIGNILF